MYKLLGSGGFGKVYLVEEKISSKIKKFKGFF